MIAALALTWLAAGVFGLVAPRLALRADPRLAVPLLSVGGLALATATTGATALMLLPWVGQDALVAHLGHWSHRTLAAHDPVSRLAALVAAAVLTAVAVRVALAGVREGLRLILTWRLAGRAGQGAAGDLVVLDGPATVAYALPGWPTRRGVTVVSQELLARLDGRGRRALLAHERAHLRCRHDLHAAAVAVAAAANPLLRTLPAALGSAAERQADGAAVRAVGDRAVVAAAIAIAAGITPPLGLAAGGGDVPARVETLLRPVAGRTTLAAALTAGAVAVAVAAGWWLAHDVDAVFDLAQAAWHR